MKYEFHVGDYVETKANSFGYISCADNDEVSWYCVHDADGHRAGEEYYVAGIENDELALYYNRIGQYDFTKPNKENSIKPLIKSWVLDDADSANEYYFDSREVIRKINELVDAVNELRKANSNAE